MKGKRVLIVTSSFFPDPYVGGIRATQWAKLLPDHGWEVIVACKNNGYAATPDEFRSKLHPSVQVRYLTNGPSPFAAPAQQSTRLAKAKTRVSAGLRRYILVPDVGIIFWRNISATLIRLIEEITPDLVITTGPPNSIHFTGLRIKQTFPSIPWVADFRDAYRHSGRYRVGWLERYQSSRNLQFEEKIYRVADRITCAIPVHERWIKMRFPFVASKTAIILNGVPDELCSAPVRKIDSGTETTIIKLVGSSEAQESIVLADAVALLRQSGQNVSLRVVGPVPSVRPAMEALLGTDVVFTGPVVHDRAIKEIASAAILVAVLSDARSRVFGISSKLFEYLAVPVPVIVINPTRPDRGLFSGLPGVYMLRNPSSEDILNAMRSSSRLSAAILEERARSVRERWSRRHQVKQLTDMIEECVCGAQQRMVDTGSYEPEGDDIRHA